MRFVANMNGVDVNKLEVLLNDQAVTSEEGNKGNQWFEKWIDLPANRDNKVDCLLLNFSIYSKVFFVNEQFVYSCECKQT